MKMHISAFFHFIGLICVAVFFCSCVGAAGPVLIRNSVDDYNALKSRKVGVAFFIPDKRILFTDQIYLVLGYSVENRYYAYEGIWDPIPVLQDKVFGELNSKYQITPISLNEVMRPDAFSAMSQFYEKNIKVAGYHNKFLKEKLSENILSELKALNIEYFLEVYLDRIGYYHPAHFDWIQCGIATYSRLNRVSDGSIVWLNKSLGGFRFNNIKSFTELEVNDLALLKQGYQESVANCEVLVGLSPQ